MASTEPELEIPHDTVNEQILLAAAMLDEKSRVYLLTQLRGDLFVDDTHRAIWNGIEDLNRRGIEFAMATLHSIISSQVEMAYLRTLAKEYADIPPALSVHVESIKWDSARAAAVTDAVGPLLSALRDPTTDRTTIRAAAKAVGSAFEVIVDKSFMRDPNALASDAMVELRKRQTMGVYDIGLEGLHKHPKTGEYVLTPGAAPQKTTLITGSSGGGKSVVTAMFILAQARLKRHCLVGAFEMGSAETLMMLATMSCGYKRSDVVTGQLDEEQLALLHIRMKAIGEYVRFFDAPFSNQLRKKYDNNDALDVLSQWINDSGCDVFVADLFERALAGGRSDDERQALFRQQQIAKETDCHQWLVCQQKSKEIDSRRNKRPTRTTILGSSAWVDIADTILGCYRPRQWDKQADETMEISVLKQRYGIWPLVMEYDWDGSLMTISHPREIDYVDPTQPQQDDDLFRGSRR